MDGFSTKILPFLAQRTITILFSLSVCFLVGVIGYMLIWYIAHFMKKRIVQTYTNANNTYGEQAGSIISTNIKNIGVVILCCILLEVAGIHISLIMTGLFLGMGLALQSTVKNIVASLIIITNKKIRIGESIKFFGSINMIGRIEKIGFRYTCLRMLDRTMACIPNTQIAETPLQAWMDQKYIRNEVLLLVGLENDPTFVQKTLCAAINTHPSIVERENTQGIISRVDAQGILMVFYFSTLPKEEFTEELSTDEDSDQDSEIEGVILKLLYKTCKEKNIRISYPRNILQVP